MPVKLIEKPAEVTTHKALLEELAKQGLEPATSFEFFRSRIEINPNGCVYCFASVKQKFSKDGKTPYKVVPFSTLRGGIVRRGEHVLGFVILDQCSCVRLAVKDIEPKKSS